MSTPSWDPQSADGSYLLSDVHPIENPRDSPSVVWLPDVVRSTGERMELKCGPRYFYYLERSTSLIETAITEEESGSPILCAATPGPRGEFAILEADDNDDCQLLRQAAIRLRPNESRRVHVSGKGASVS